MCVVIAAVILQVLNKGEKLQVTFKKRAKNAVFRRFMVFSPEEKHNLGKNIDYYFMTNYDRSIDF